MKYLAIIIIFIFASCYNDVGNIQIQGTIKDGLSKKPIGNAEVSIVCWSYGKTPDGSYTGKDSIFIIASKDGFYKCNFEKGAYIEVKVYSDGYQTGYKSDDIVNEKNIIDFDLKPNKATDFNLE
ncbi:hypothetical protein LNQ49_00935 [Flavobacterium sp. F-65]|jgi:hypothetical protein|uniref:Carboxypeptidase regulatory-like domain-containing protein n=1 Tax=Flavobacterium pisciphilum TaxID=2893755 RepID=A0ABS8MQE6_9FLAO|nr:hypothetical protein [Flavobacterium sp. F-65]MCC9070170.1 hypothetical protein [Flavobacterium sp. F-65]